MKQLFTSLATCLMIMSILLFASGVTAADTVVPESDQLRVFLDQADPMGVKNGTKMNLDYDATDPDTWTGITFNENGKVQMIDMRGLELCGIFEIDGFDQLQAIILSENAICAASIRNCPELAAVSMENNILTSFVCESLGNDNERGVDIFLGHNRINNMVIPESVRAGVLSLSFNEIEYIDVSTQSNLVALELLENNVSDIVFGNHPKLLGLILDRNNIRTLSFSNELSSIVSLTCGQNPLEQLDISHLRNLEELSCNYTQISELDVSSNTDLRFLNVAGCRFSSLSLLNHQDIQSLLLQNSNITELDLSGCNSLRYLNTNGTPLKSFNYLFNTIQTYLNITAEGSGYVNFEVKTDDIVFNSSPAGEAAFLGWLDGETYEILSGADSFTVSASTNQQINLIASYEEVPVSISFIDGLSNEVIETRRVLAGDIIHDMPEPPYHEGHEFTGYDYHGEPIIAQTEIYALYRQIEPAPTSDVPYPTSTPNPPSPPNTGANSVILPIVLAIICVFALTALCMKMRHTQE